MNVILVPHAHPTYTKIACELISNILGDYDDVIVLSTNHGLGNEEHSFEWSMENFPQWRKKVRRVIYVDDSYLNLESIKESIKEYSNCLIIANTDFTHYGPNYDNDRDNVDIEPYILGSIQNLDLDAYMEYYSKLENGKPCGHNVIVSMIQICNHLNIKYCMPISHYNSGNVKGDYSNWVSYASMIFYKEVPKGVILNTNIIELPYIRRIKYPLPTIKAPIFVSLITTEGRPVACTGNTDNNSNTKKILERTIKDFNSGRLDSYDNNINKTVIEITILSDRESWERISIEEFIERDRKGLINRDNTGVELEGVSIFIPSVWRKYKTLWNAKKVIQELESKGNNTGTFVNLFKETGMIY